MKAIITKFLPCTNTKPSRVVASDGDGNRAVVSYDQSLNSEDAHFEAVRALCAKMDWRGSVVCGSLKTGYAWTFVDWRNNSGYSSKAIPVPVIVIE